MISDPVSKVIAAAVELKVLKLQKGQQLHVKVKNISGVGDVCVLLDDAKQVFWQGSEVVAMGREHVVAQEFTSSDLSSAALATSVEASSSGNPNFSINICLLAEVEVASTRSVFKNLLFLQFLGNNGIVFVSEGKMEITNQTRMCRGWLWMKLNERCGYGWNEILKRLCASPCNKSNSFRIYVGWIWLKQIKYIKSKIESKMFCLKYFKFSIILSLPFQGFKYLRRDCGTCCRYE